MTETSTAAAVSPARDTGPALLRLMLALTFTTGIVDAIGYLGLDRVFTANMTGNVVILGMALTGADDLPVAGPLIALGGFVLGAVLAGRALGGRTGAWSAVTTAMLGGVAGVVVAIGAVLLLWDGAPEPALLVITGALWPRRLLAVLLMLAGAAVGAALLRVHAGAGLLVAGLICAAVAAIGHARCRG